MLERLGGGDGDQQRLAVGQADVLAGEDHHPPGDEPGVLAGLEHAGEVVHGGLRIAPRMLLMNALHHVVVVVAAVAQRAGAERRLDVLELDVGR